MDSGNFEQYSQQDFVESIAGDSNESQYRFNSTHVQPQTPISHSSSFAPVDQFQQKLGPANLQYQRTFPLNPMKAQVTSQQQFGPGFSYQGLLNAQVTSQQVDSSNSSKATKRRGNASKNPETTTSTTLRRWTTEEDVALTKARLYISGDADVGTGQKSETMWRRILQVWRENMVEYDSTRDSNALECRWTRLQSAINKFHGFYEQLERYPRSGTTPEDMKKEAHRMFKETNNNLQFKHEECWEICRKNPKWCSHQLTKQGASKKHKPNVDNSLLSPSSATKSTPASTAAIDGVVDPSTTIAENGDFDGVERPEGRKAAKERKRKIVGEKGVADALGSLQCTLEKQYELSRDELELKKEREKKDYDLREKNFSMEIELKERNQRMKEKSQRRKEQERFLEKDLTKLPLQLRETYERMQAQILKEWENEGPLGEVSGGDGTA